MPLVSATKSEGFHGAEQPSASLIQTGKLAENAPEMPKAAMPDATKISAFLDAATAKAGEMNPQVARCLVVTKPFIIVPIQIIMCLAPFYLWMIRWAIKIYQVLPVNFIWALFGLALCFFGGTYVASIAAIEAFRQMGWQRVYAELEVVYVQMLNVHAAYAKDAASTNIEQMSREELAKRLTFIALRSINEPARLQSAVGSLWTSYIAVLATLRLEFARTTAFALGIVEMTKNTMVRVCSPALIGVLYDELGAEGAKAWSVTIIETVLTAIAVAFAWYLQMIIAAFYSGMRGGRMFADAVCNILVDWGWMEHLPCVPKPYKPEKTYVDEIIAYTLAAVGFGFQFLNGFALPCPMNLVFLPLTLIEWFLRIQITLGTDLGSH